jgi:hypothetical protein
LEFFYVLLKGFDVAIVLGFKQTQGCQNVVSQRATLNFRENSAIPLLDVTKTFVQFLQT